MRFGEVLGSPNACQNRILKGFLRCFFEYVRESILLVIFSCFFRVRTLIFVRTASVLEHFHRIGGFFFCSKKNMDFGSVFGGRNGEKSRKICVEKHAFFGYRFFSVFVRFLKNLARFWEALKVPKIVKQFKKRKNRFSNAFSFEGGFWDGSGAVLGGF